MSKRDVPVLRFAVRGDEKQIMELPCGLLCFVRGLPLFKNQRAKNAPEDHDRQSLRLEVDEENTPWLITYKGTELFYFFNLYRCLRIQTQFFGGIVKGELFKVFGFYRPVQVVTKIFHERRECLYRAEA